MMHFLYIVYQYPLLMYIKNVLKFFIFVCLLSLNNNHFYLRARVHMISDNLNIL